MCTLRVMAASTPRLGKARGQYDEAEMLFTRALEVDEVSMRRVPVLVSQKHLCSNRGAVSAREHSDRQ